MPQEAALPDPSRTPRLTVALTFDHDAISDSVRRGDPPVKLSQGEFGPRVGVPRILELLQQRRDEVSQFDQARSVMVKLALESGEVLHRKLKERPKGR